MVGGSTLTAMVITTLESKGYYFIAYSISELQPCHDKPIERFPRSSFLFQISEALSCAVDSKLVFRFGRYLPSVILIPIIQSTKWLYISSKPLKHVP